MKNLTTIIFLLLPLLAFGQELNKSVSADYSFSSYSEIYDPAHLTSIQYGQKSGWGSLLGRMNVANRFSKTGIQFEVDAYPKIADGIYAYLNYGYSAYTLFPKQRTGAEIYSSFPKAFEGSLGFRYLYFGSGSDVMIYTASIGKYYGDYWFSLRSFITPADVSFSRSLGLTVRYYYADVDEYLTAKVSGGFSPDDKNYDPANGSVYLLESQSFGLGWKKPLSDVYILTISADYTKQELVFSPGNFVRVYSFSAEFLYKF